MGGVVESGDGEIARVVVGISGDGDRVVVVVGGGRDVARAGGGVVVVGDGDEGAVASGVCRDSVGVFLRA